MRHHHHHHHHGTEKISADLKNIYIIVIVLIALYIAFEAWMGFRHNALTLVSDAGHKLIDVFSLSLTLITFWLSTTKARKNYTWGFRKLSVIISLFNAVLVVIVAVTIIWESIEKVIEPGDLAPDGGAISITAAVGFVVNCIAAFLLSLKRSHDVNTMGQFIHTLTDALVYVGMVISGFIIKWTGLAVIDPVISILIALFVLFNIWSVLKESFRMSIDGVPSSVHVGELLDQVRAVPGVREVSDLHIWPVSTVENALSATLVLDDSADRTAVTDTVKAVIKTCGIENSFLETR
ncbi:MAG: cation transporter [Bacteroidales bacterium]|nr:cation transporter [Bacteroidales bacterium]